MHYICGDAGTTRNCVCRSVCLRTLCLSYEYNVARVCGQRAKASVTAERQQTARAYTHTRLWPLTNMPFFSEQTRKFTNATRILQLTTERDKYAHTFLCVGLCASAHAQLGRRIVIASPCCPSYISRWGASSTGNLTQLTTRVQLADVRISHLWSRVLATFRRR